MRSLGSWLCLSTLGATLACGPGTTDADADGPRETERERILGPFLRTHWSLPVQAQGAAPEGFSEVEAALDPSVCGACHPKQYAEWSGSLHAQAWSPGLAGQLIEGGLAQPAEQRACHTCHAPLSEQIPFDAALEASPHFDAALRERGVLCAGCHVRAHRRYGPARRVDAPPATGTHGGVEERAEYAESRFCAECHQFFDDAGANGKPIENTFAEWLESPQAAEGRQCQACHMPDREHRWRGIHDPEMVRAAVDVDLVRVGEGDTQVSLVLRNRDVGHAFPTYVTPRVFLRVLQVDAGGEVLEGTVVEAEVGREVDLARNLEVFDTRVLPGESVRLDYTLARHERAAALLGRVVVDPDHHYRGVFEDLLATLSSPVALAEIERAAARISETPYTLAEIRRPL